jgi:hypothetical protein
MKLIALILLSLTLTGAEFETTTQAIKAGNGAVEVLKVQDDCSVDLIVIPQAKILRDAVRFFQSHSDDDFSEEQLDQISLIQKALHNCRMRMDGSQMERFNQSAVAMVPSKAKPIAKK